MFKWVVNWITNKASLHLTTKAEMWNAIENSA